MLACRSRFQHWWISGSTSAIWSRPASAIAAIGLDEESLGRIFSPFVQADISTTRKYGGSGLGLVISRQLAQMMDGDIQVVSTPEIGSLFRVRLPFKLPPGQTGEADTGRQAGLLAGLACLVLGDPDGMASDLASYLSYDEAVVERTANQATALQWIANRPSGRVVVVIDARVASPLLDELRVAARARPEVDTHFVVIRRGLRRGLRDEDSHLVSMDGNILTRRILRDAVANAAGLGPALAHAPVPARNASEGASVPKAPLAAMSAENLSRHSGRILVADDNEINRNVIQHQLTLLGYGADLPTMEARRWPVGTKASTPCY
jgi:hypothetical protein